MSDIKKVSPLLDDYSLGQPYSMHNGVTCCPAIHAVTNEKFILKHISIPESQTQVDAMVLTGACLDRTSAQLYYEEVAADLVREVEVLQSLAQTRGFAAFLSHQLTRKEDGQVGMDLWLLSPYKTTLSAHMKRSAMTYLEAVNLGIDLCAALTLCRKFGYIYGDLKPENIYMTQQRKFQLGDLGLIAQSELTYATLPDKYRSAYTPPELFDDFAELNETMDIYALGMVLFQVYNDGRLPFADSSARSAEEELAAPAYADYEMAEIILKAIAFDPANRWQNPEDMGQALVSYMQRNPVNDDMIAPPAVTAPALNAVADQKENEMAEDVKEEVPAQEEPPVEEKPMVVEEPTEEVPAEMPVEEPAEDQSVPAEEDAEPGATVQDEELADILSRANLLLEETEEGKKQEQSPQQETAQKPEPVDDVYGEEEKAPRRKLSVKGIIGTVCALLLVVGLAVGGYLFYRHYYLVSVDSFEVVSNTLDTLTVEVRMEGDPSVLHIVCQDTFGNTHPGTLKNGQATFTELQPNTQYTVKLSVTGLHKLEGPSVVTHTTAIQTEIADFNAITGSEDGSAILTFTPNGTEPNDWTVTWEADGVAPKTMTFTGHKTTVNGLEVGKVYTFKLTASGGVYLTGADSLTYTAIPVVLAQNLTVNAYDGNSMTVSWDVPETAVESWEVRCYDGADFEVIQNVTDCTAVIEGLNPASPYTVEVTAAGMTEKTWIPITANAVFINGCTVNMDVPGEMTITWDYVGTAPENWVFVSSYSEDPDAKSAEQTEENAVTISPCLPNTAYTFTIQTADGSTVFNSTYSAVVPEAESFADFGVTAENITMETLHAPENENWTVEDLDLENNKSDTFSISDEVAFVLEITDKFEKSEADVQVLILVRDADGIPVDYSYDTTPWYTMWTENTYLGQLRQTPQTPGEYVLEVYFNHRMVHSRNITITE